MTRRWRRRWCFVVCRLTNGISVQGYDRVRCRISGGAVVVGGDSSLNDACRRARDPSTYGLFAYFLFTASKSNPICGVRTAAAIGRCRRCITEENDDDDDAFFLPNLLRLSAVAPYLGPFTRRSSTSGSAGTSPSQRPTDWPLTAVMAFSTSFIPPRPSFVTVGAPGSRHPPMNARFLFRRRRMTVQLSLWLQRMI